MTYKKLTLFSHTLHNGNDVIAYIQNDRVHFTGSSTGDHSIEYPIGGDMSRVEAHWQGYLSAAIEAYENWFHRDLHPTI